MKQVRLIKACLNETYNKVHIAKCLFDSFPIQNSFKQGEALSSLNELYFWTLSIVWCLKKN